MTKRSHDLLRNVLDELCVTPIYTAACARCGISTKTLWRYVRASQREDDPEKYWFVWSDAEAWFHDHLKHAMRLSALMIEATARHHALNGFDEVQVFQGKMCWKEDPKLAGLSDDELAQLGRSDRYERNADGTFDSAHGATEAERSVGFEDARQSLSAHLWGKSRASIQQYHSRGGDGS